MKSILGKKLIKWGIKMRGSQKNKNYKAKWTPKFAYAVGLITADGCLSSDGRHIDFTSKDIQLVRTFKKCMDLVDAKIGTKTSGFTNKRYPRIQFSNVRLYRWLLKIGLTPNKSKRIGKLKIPNKYFFDFLRGHFDGDGDTSMLIGINAGKIVLCSILYLVPVAKLLLNG